MRATAILVVAVVALFVAALATVISGPPVASRSATAVSPARTSIPGPTGLPPVVTIANSSRAGVLYAIVGDEPSQLFRTTDGGFHWAVLNTQLPTGPPGQSELITDGVSPGAFYLVRGGTIYRFTDDDTTLRPVPTPGGARGDVFTGTLAFPPWQAGTIFWRVSERLLARTYDGGRSWTSLTLPGPTNALVAAPSRPGLLYAFIDRVVWQSSDYGDHWYSVSPADPVVLGSAFVPRLAVDPSDPLRLIAGTAAGVYVSADGGESWKLSWAAPAEPGGRGEPIWRFAFDTVRHNIYASKLTPLYAGNPTLLSQDGGRTWKETLIGEIGARQLVITGWPEAPIYIGTNRRGIYVARDIAGPLEPRSDGLGRVN